MKKIASLLIVIALAAVCAFAQTTVQATPDLTGNWALDKDSSVFSYRDGRRQNDTSDKNNYENYTLKISQNGAEITILQSFLFKSTPHDYKITVFTDKRGEKNICPHKQYTFGDYSKENFWLEDVGIASKTQWKKNKLMRDGTYRALKYNTVNHLLNQTYELTNNDKTLIVTSDLSIMVDDPMFSQQKSKLVFQKQP